MLPTVTHAGGDGTPPVSRTNRIQLLLTCVAVEKLFPVKFAKTTLHQDALQTPFSVFLTLAIPQLLGVLTKMEFFNSHSRLTTTAPA